MANGKRGALSRPPRSWQFQSSLNGSRFRKLASERMFWGRREGKGGQVLWSAAIHRTVIPRAARVGLAYCRAQGTSDVPNRWTLDGLRKGKVAQKLRENGNPDYIAHTLQGSSSSCRGSPRKPAIRGLRIGVNARQNPSPMTKNRRPTRCASGDL